MLSVLPEYPGRRLRLIILKIASLSAAVKNVLAETEENNRALKSLCDFATRHTLRPYCSGESNLSAPSITIIMVFGRR